MKHRKFYQTLKAACAAGILLCTASCSGDEAVMEMPEPQAPVEGLPSGWVTARGELNTSLTGYVGEDDASLRGNDEEQSVSRTAYDGASAATRAEAPTWNDGEKIYFLIESGQDKIPVVAVYSKVFDAWSFSHDASADIPASGTMRGCYFEGTTRSDFTGVALADTGQVYIDAKAQYTYQDESFSVSVNLKPSYVRMRFAGLQGQGVFFFSGINRVVSFDASTYTFEQQPVTCILKASTEAVDGKYFTPYVYGYLNAENKISISTGAYAYSRMLAAGTLSSGESGWMNMPSDNYIPKGWMATDDNPFSFSVSANGLSVSANGVSFNMILVEHGTFQMGSTYNSNEQPVHSVTLTRDYYMGETEVTQELWRAVMGSNPSYYTGTQRPVERVTWNDCQSFITELNSLTGLTFRLPTEAEWEFAARGGNQSQGYTYSGSNTIGNVACYSGNYSSGHNVVKSKAPNELGLYDMSGNVWEWCQDWYDFYYYSSSPSTDPTGPASGSDRVLRGGGWDFDATCCRVAYRHSYMPSDTYYYSGFRLALSGFH